MTVPRGQAPSRSPRIGIAGLSHLGLVMSAATATKGFEVIAYDAQASRGEALRQGRLPIIEPGLPELLAQHRARVRVISDPQELSACPLVVLAADVPTDADNQSHLAEIDGLLEQVAAHAVEGAVLVVLSQVAPGFTRRLDRRLSLRRPDRRLQVFYQVETLVFGEAVARALNPERFIVGCRAPEETLPAPYARWLDAFGCPILPMRYESAELAKLAVNLFLVSSVTTTNTLAELCEAVGADWGEIVPALRLDRRIGPHAYLQPGLGLSGGNLERDLITFKTVAQAHGTDATVVEAWLSNSRRRREWTRGVLRAEVALERQPVIAVWGLAYKAGTRSTKNAPALSLVASLASCPVQVYDPAVTLDGAAWPQVAQAASALEACRGAEALVVMTPWPEFAEADLEQARALMRGRVIVDPVGRLDHRRCVALGFRHHRLGAPGDAADRRDDRTAEAAPVEVPVMDQAPR